MKYYSITSTTKNRVTDEVIGSSGFLVMVESEDEVKTIIEKEKQSDNQDSKYYEDDYIYTEVSANDYIKYQEDAVLRSVKASYLNELDIDKTLSIREYNKLRNTDENVANALRIFLKREAIISDLKKNIDLKQISVSDYLEVIDKLLLISNDKYVNELEILKNKYNKQLPEWL